MMNRAKVTLHNLGGVVFCFLAAVAIAAAALNIGLNTEPGKILPDALSMRTGSMGENLIRGIDIALEDLELIRSGSAGNDLWRLLTFVHLDPFFYLAIILPQAAAKSVLMAGYYIRFGLCCSCMYYFMSGHLKLRRMFSAMLAVMYTFSTQIIFTAQFASVMNMAILFPVVLSAFDSYLQKRTWRAFSGICFSVLALSATGGFGIMTGIPAVIFTGLLMCISLYSTFKMAFTSWLKLLGGIFAGLAASMAFAIPGFAAMNIDLKISESFENAKVNYTVFDILRGTFALRSGSIYSNGIPLFYIGILTLVAVIAFALNERIPVRMKVATAVLTAVIHILCSSSFVNETVSIFGTAPVLNSSRLIWLEVILFFAAAIGLKNIRSLSRGDLLAAGLIPLFFMIIANNSSNSTSLASPIVISTFLAVIFEAILVYASSEDKIGGKARYVILVAVFVLVGVNTAFIMFNNTIQSAAAYEYFRGDNDLKASDRLILDNELDIPAINGNDTYLLIPADLSMRETSDSFINVINHLSWILSDEDLFEQVFIEPADKGDFELVGADSFRLEEGHNRVEFEPFTVGQGERVFAYCNSESGASMEAIASGGDYERFFTGPFLTEISPDPGEITLKFDIESRSSQKCRITLYKMNGRAYDMLKAAEGYINGSRFLVDIKDINGVCTVVLPYAYDSSTRIRIDGKDSGSFSYCGKTAITYNADRSDVMEISVEQRSTGLVPGVLISVFAVSCLIVIPVFQMYNEKKKVTGEGTIPNA